MDVNPVKAAPFFREPAAGAKVNVLGLTHVYKATAAETAGSFSLWEMIVPPGLGAPPHAHQREDESFFVLRGELLVELDGEPAPRRVGPGGFFFGARGRRHAFRNVGVTPAHALVLSTPSCGLDRMFVELEAATANGTPEMEKLAAVAARYGVDIAPHAG